VLSAFNYAKGINEGIEFTAKFHSGNFQAYRNLAVAQQKATQPVSNQFLFDNITPLADLGGLTRFQYLQTHWIFTDHNQFVTASAGALYQFCGRAAYANETFSGALGGPWTAPSWCGTKLSADMIYGSGLRSGDANTSTVPPYTQQWWDRSDRCGARAASQASAPSSDPASLLYPTTSAARMAASFRVSAMAALSPQGRVAQLIVQDWLADARSCSPASV
jgi:hypothetical protein